jgi:hypothetical protein
VHSNSEERGVAFCGPTISSAIVGWSLVQIDARAGVFLQKISVVVRGPHCKILLGSKMSAHNLKKAGEHGSRGSILCPFRRLPSVIFLAFDWLAIGVLERCLNRILARKNHVPISLNLPGKYNKNSPKSHLEHTKIALKNSRLKLVFRVILKI